MQRASVCSECCRSLCLGDVCEQYSVYSHVTPYPPISLYKYSKLLKFTNSKCFANDDNSGYNSEIGTFTIEVAQSSITNLQFLEWLFFLFIEEKITIQEIIFFYELSWFTLSDATIMTIDI